MTRPLLIRSDKHPYHITCRCINKDFFPLPLEEVWSVMMEILQLTHKKHDLAIHAFILMGNHFHLLCHTPKDNLDEAMRFFMRETSVQIRKKARSAHPLWDGRYRWSLIASPTYYYQVYRYLFQNPIRAKVVSKVQDYPFSTLNDDVDFPLHTSLPMSFGGKEGEILWLNQEFDEEDQKLIKLGLRKNQFDINRRKQKGFFERLKKEGEEGDCSK